MFLIIEEIKKRKREKRRKEKRRRRCRLLRRAGIKCKRKDNSLDNIPINYYLPVPGETGDATHLNYYRQSAELLKLLNLKKDKSDKQNKDKKSKNNENRSEDKT